MISSILSTTPTGEYERDSPRPVEHAYRSIDLAFTSCVAKLGIQPISDREPYFNKSMNVWIIHDAGEKACCVVERWRLDSVPTGDGPRDGIDSPWDSYWQRAPPCLYVTSGNS